MLRCNSPHLQRGTLDLIINQFLGYIYVHGEITLSNLAIILTQQIEITTTIPKHEYFNKMVI